jgi:hypothetical protein
MEIIEQAPKEKRRLQKDSPITKTFSATSKIEEIEERGT